MRRVLRGALSNIVTFLLSFCLALFIWLTATQENDPVIFEQVQVQLELPVPSNASLVRPASSSVNVSINVEGRASVLKEITREDFAATVDLTDVPLGEDTAVAVNVQQLDPRIDITSWDPLQITVNLEGVVTRDIPVEVEIRGSVARGHSAGKESVDPAFITVTGKESVVDSLDMALVTVFLDDNRETLVESRPPIFYDTQNQVASVRSLQLSTRDVEVTIPISESADFAEKFISVNLVGQPAPGYRVLSVSVDPPTVLVRGRPTQLDNLIQIRTEPIDITGLTETFEAPVALALPDGIELDELVEIVVTAEIEAFQSSQTFIREVEIQGLENGLMAEIDPETVRIVLFGPSPVLASLADDEIEVTVDLFDLEEGTYAGLEPRVDFPDRGIELRSVQPSVVTAIITSTITTSQQALPTPTAVALLRHNLSQIGRVFKTSDLLTHNQTFLTGHRLIK